MSTHSDLEQLKRHLERIDHGLGEARRQISLLEAKLAAEDTEREPAVTTAAPVLPPKSPFPPPPLPIAPATSAIHRSHSPVPRPTIAYEPAEPSPFKVWLQKLQLWPPSGDDNAEVRLGAWWTTRVGALLAVIGVVFFGAYISLNTMPWMKFIELAAIALGVSAFGLWLTRKFEIFGGVVLAGGLALGYFTTYAGYALPAVKVIDNVWMAVGCQIAAVAIIVAAALWRRSQTIATLAVGLGFVTAVFSRNGGLAEFALLTAGLLGAVSVGLQRRRGWEAPSVVAMPCAYGLLALVWHGAWQRGTVPTAGFTWSCIVALAVLFYLRDWRRVKACPADVTNGERWFQGVNSSLASLFGVVLTLSLYRGDLANFYFGTAALLATMAWLRFRQVEDDAVCAVLVAKTSGALTLGVIEIVDARTTAIALLVQAWVTAWTARRLDSRVLAYGTLVVAMVATWFHFTDGIAPTIIFSPGALQATLFGLGLAALATEAGRWLIRNSTSRQNLAWLTAFAAGSATIAAAVSWLPAGWTPATLTGLTALFALTGWAHRGEAAGWAAALTLLAANGLLWNHASGSDYDSNLGLNAAVVLVVTGGLSWVLGGREAWRKWSPLAGVITVIGTVLTCFNLCSTTIALGLTAGAALIITHFAPRAAGRTWNGLATLAAGLGVWLWVSERMTTTPTLWIAGAAVALWALPVLRRWKINAGADQVPSRTQTLMDALQVTFAVIVTLRLLIAQFHGAALVAALTTAGAGVFALGVRPGLRAAVPASWVLGIAAALAAAMMRVSPLDYLSYVWLVGAIVLIWLPAWIWTRFAPNRNTRESRWFRKAAGIQVILAAVLSALIARRGFSGLPELFACITVCLAALGVLRFCGVASARMGGIALTVLLGATTLNFINHPMELGWGRALGGAALSSLVIALLPCGFAGGPLPWSAATSRRAHWLGGGAGLALWFLACLAQRGPAAPYITVGWGLAAAVWFLGGLILRAAPYRLLGLIGLALCIPRVFFVDLQSPLYRIVAFIVLGLVLLWVGFSYHRFRHLIADTIPCADTKPNA